MINGQSVLAIIPARGGSKRVPGKNLRSVGGRPLLQWTIEAAKGSALVDRLVLSSEDREIQRVAAALGCEVPFSRPASLALDETPGIEPVLHALDQLPGYDFVVLLQPTSPLRETADIDRCLALCVEADAPVCVSVTTVDKSPDWYYGLAADHKLSRWLRPQENRSAQSAPLYVLNGAVYVARTQWLIESKTFLTDQTAGYVMPSLRSVDIDSELDIELANALLKMREAGQASWSTLVRS